MTYDVTAGYIIMDVERLRKPMRKITDEFLRLMEVGKTGQKRAQQSDSVFPEDEHKGVEIVTL